MRQLLPLLITLLLTLSAGQALAAPRVALVIGNSSYEEISPLVNPKHDAAAMSTTLREVGFTVIEANDADIRAMARAIREFGKRLRQAGPEAVGLFFYAGHGVQARGRNYLIPLGALIETEADLDVEAISAANVLAQMEEAGNALNMVILDACRNNPFKGNFRSGGRGLTRMDAPSGSLVAFAAAPGQVASDGQGNNSPYTAALVAAMKQPGIAVEQVFKKVRIEVEGATGRSQTPWEESSLKGDFYFIAPNAQVTVQQAPDQETVFWQSVESSQDPALYQAYLTQYPNGAYAAIARIKLQQAAAAPAATARQSQTQVQNQVQTQSQAQAQAPANPTPPAVTQTAKLPPANADHEGDWSGRMDSGFKAAVTVTGNRGKGILRQFNKRGDMSFTIAPDGKVSGRVLFGSWNQANATLKGVFPNIYVESGALEVRGRLNLERD